MLDASGWTIIPTPTGDYRFIYVSASGSNSNDGLSIGSPKQTLSAALPLLRSNKPDWIYLKRGDTFYDAGSWRIETAGGPSSGQISGISSYGSGDRPILLHKKMWYGTTTIPLKNFAVLDLDFYASYRDPQSPLYGSGATDNTAFQILLGESGSTLSNNILLENNRFRYYMAGVHIDGRQGSTTSTSVPNVTVRRNSFMYAGEFGLQIYYTSGALVEENAFYKNGWDQRTVQLHNMYMSSAINPIVRKNFFSHGGNMSIKLSGNSKNDMINFVIENNVFNRGMMGMGHASLNGSWNPFTEYSHNSGVVQNNVMMKVGKIIPWNSSSTQAIGFNIGNLNNVLFENNIFAHNDEYLSGGEIFRFADPSTELSANITARNNVVWNWLSTQFNAVGKYMIYDTSVTNFVQENNLPTGVTYVNPSASIASYNASLGGSADEEEFLSVVYNMHKDNWDDRYTAEPFIQYMQAAFTDLSTLPSILYIPITFNNLNLVLNYNRQGNN